MYVGTQFLTLLGYIIVYRGFAIDTKDGQDHKSNPAVYVKQCLSEPMNFPALLH